MITMRSAPNNKMTKPPPPVPPRPSKNVVAEALAKTRKPLPAQPEISTAARPPATGTALSKPNLDYSKPTVVVKTQSYYPVNYCNIKPKQDDPSSPAASYDSPKPVARTIIYQSNIATTVVSSSNVNETRPQEAHLINGCIVNSNGETKSSSNTDASISRTDSFKSKSSGSQHFNIITSSNSIHCSENSTAEDLPENINGTSSSNSNWTDILNDRNHVNTLIDEMFASVLDQPQETNYTIQTVNENVITPALPCQNEDISDVSAMIPITDDNCINETTTVSESCSSSVAELKKAVTFQEESSAESNTSTQERKSQLRNDRQNHEQLIAELASMKHEKNINKRQRNPSRNACFGAAPVHLRRIHHSDWVEVTKTGQEVRLSSCQITIDEPSSGVVHKNNVNNLKLLGPDDGEDSSVDSVISRCTNMSAVGNMQGLPPLPKSLSGFSIMMENSNIHGHHPSTLGSNMVPHTVHASHVNTLSMSNGTIDTGSLKKESTLDSKLALLRREMYSLRQLDLSLLSQLWSLNESIQDFRQILQENEGRGGAPMSPPSPSPTASSVGDDGALTLEDNDDDEVDDIEDEDEDSTAPFFTPRPMRYRPAPPPPPPSNISGSVAGGAHASNSSSGTSSV